MVAINISQIEKIVGHYLQELKKHGIQPERIILYGSHAKGNAKPYSDIDLVVISKDLAKWPPLERMQLLSRATLHVDAPLEVLGYTPDEIKKRGADSIFWEEISRTGKDLFKKAA